MALEKNKTRTLVIATRNAHKVEEIRAILGEGFLYQTLNDYPGAPKVVEDADTFAGNAMKKAVELAEWLSNSQDIEALVLADDSGLEVDALGGAPGVHSARFAALEEKENPASAKIAANAMDAANNAKLLRLLRDVPEEQRSARFRCTLALVPVCSATEAERQAQLFDGTCEGRIDYAARGGKGFGYDPLFIPSGFQESFAQLGEEVKNRISHRAGALAKLRDWLKKNR